MILSTFDALNFVIKRVLTLVCFYIFCFFHIFSSWCQFKLTLGFLPFIPIKKFFFSKKSCFRWFQHKIFHFLKQNKKFAISRRYGLNMLMKQVKVLQVHCYRLQRTIVRHKQNSFVRKLQKLRCANTLLIIKNKQKTELMCCCTSKFNKNEKKNIKAIAVFSC